MTNENTTKVLWLSRHPMTPEQLAELEVLYGPMEVIQENMTYPARGPEAAGFVVELALQTNIKTIAGVFPAHVAAALVRRAAYELGGDVRFELGGIQILVPVSVPSPAKEGETRGGGFTHSHWEPLW